MKFVQRSLLGAFATALVMSAVAASAAFAGPQWYVVTGGSQHAVTSALQVVGTGTVSLHDSQFSNMGLTCEVETTGTVEAGGLGKITGYVAKRCVSSSCPQGVSALPERTPWKTELYLGEFGQIRNRIVSGGSGEPRYNFTCYTVGTHFEDKCNLPASLATLNQTEVGPVKETFEELPKTFCTASGTYAGAWEGSIKIAAPAGTEGILVKKS